jgi:hypothetical protein
MSDNLFAAFRKGSVGMWVYCFFDRYDKNKIIAWCLIFAKAKWKDGRCCWTERGRNERIVVSDSRDGKRHGPAMNQTVAARALGWRSEVSADNRSHGPARR